MPRMAMTCQKDTDKKIRMARLRHADEEWFAA
jgi:hypothetical protein